MGADLFHADRRTGEKTDKTKLIVVLRDFEYAPKKNKQLMKLHEKT